MLNPRILTVLSQLPNAETALDMVLDALAKAGRPFCLRFALPRRFEAAVEEAALPQSALNVGDIKFYEGSEGLAGVLPVLTDETHFLSLEGEHVFAEKWETVLLSRYGRIPAQQAVMTAVINGEGDAAQAYLPAFSGSINQEGAGLGTGLALVCSAAPVKTLLLHPAFLFGKLDFLRQTDLNPATLSIAAYAAGYSAFAFDRAPLWPMRLGNREARLARPGPEALPPTALSRFEQLAGISFEQGTVTVRAMQGLFAVEDGYAQRLPLRLSIRQHAQSLLHRSPQPLPLFVTAFIDLPEALHPPLAYMLRFSYLKSLRHLPLTLYAGGEMERHLRSRFPNTLAYPDNSLLPRSNLAEGMTPMQLFKRNKLLLLQRTARSYPSFSHIAWLDIDTLPYPLCPATPMDFSALMDNRVHIGWVDGEPDTSMMVVPARHLKLMVHEVQAVTQFDAALKRSFSERELIRRLLEKFPDLFTLHPLPEKGLLFFTSVDASLLSAATRESLSDLPAPIRVPPVVPAQKERKPHDPTLP